jgi:hypothetical protein
MVAGSNCGACNALHYLTLPADGLKHLKVIQGSEVRKKTLWL